MAWPEWQEKKILFLLVGMAWYYYYLWYIFFLFVGQGGEKRKEYIENIKQFFKL